MLFQTGPPLNLLPLPLNFPTVGTADTTAPVIANCPADITMPVASAGDTAVVVTWTPPTATDNVTPASQLNAPFVTHSPGDMFLIATTTVTYIFIDAAGNQAPCSFNVIVTCEYLYFVSFSVIYCECKHSVMHMLVCITLLEVLP